MAVQRITRTMAEYAAKGMKEKAFGEVLKSSKERLTNYAYKLITKYIPMVLYTEKAKKYLILSSSVDFSCDDNLVHVYGLEVPRLQPISLPRSEFEKVRASKKEYDQVCIQSMNFYKKCINTITDLKTVSRLQKEFPEAVEYLPKEAVETTDENIASLQQILKT